MVGGNRGRKNHATQKFSEDGIGVWGGAAVGGRLQTLYLYDTLTDRRIDLGRFHEPREFTGEWRVDLHARTSPDGKRIIFDSSHSGERQMWMLDMSRFDYVN